MLKLILMIKKGHRSEVRTWFERVIALNLLPRFAFSLLLLLAFLPPSPLPPSLFSSLPSSLALSLYFVLTCVSLQIQELDFPCEPCQRGNAFLAWWVSRPTFSSHLLLNFPDGSSRKLSVSKVVTGSWLVKWNSVIHVLSRCWLRTYFVQGIGNMTLISHCNSIWSLSWRRRQGTASFWAVKGL